MRGPTPFGDEETAESGERDRRGGAIRRRLDRLFDVRAFLVALALVSAGLFVGGAVPLFGAVGRLVGVAVATFALGLAGSRRRYLEVAVAGALAAGVGFVLGVLTSALFPVGVSVLRDHGVALAGVGSGGGALTAVVGYYFGRDLRAGLTRDV